jgi:hypothetical protein
MNKIIVALIGFPLSFIFIIYRFKIKRFTGNIGFAERVFGAGGTYTLLLLVGIGIFITTLLYVTGTLQSVLQSFFGSGEAAPSSS